MLNTCNWTDELSTNETLDIALALAHYEAKQAGSFARELSDLLDARDWKGLLNFDFRYNENRAVMDYVRARQTVAYFEKLEPLGELLGVDREAAAYAKFLESERVCAETNALFEAYRRGKLCFTPAFEHILHAAKWKIEKVLGEAPDFQDLRPKLGPGASTTVRRKNACAAEKLAGRLACSTNFIPYLPLFLAGHPHLVRHQGSYSDEDGCDVWRFSITEDVGRLTFVKKDAKSFRSIVVEPSISSMYQLAVGDVIARRLRRNGVDIRNQVLNQDLARYGSISGALATLDLSSASDTIAKELVQFLLPDEWYTLLNGFRSPTVEYNGTEVPLEKFSSMGNGATFPLETLIFFALVWAASPHRDRPFITAYGDDIICGSENSGQVINVLEACGFTINKAKSFVEGPFRESCGADYYLGVDIRPYRLKRQISGEVLFSMHNFFKRNHDDDRCNLILDLIPHELRLWGPDGYGDGHLVSHERLTRSHKRDSGWAGYTFDTFTRRARKSIRVHPGDYLQVLYSRYIADGEWDSDPYAQTSNAHQMHEALRDQALHQLNMSYAVCMGQKGKVVKTYPLEDHHRAYNRISVYTLHP